MLRDASGPPSSPTSRAAVEDYDHAGRARLGFAAALTRDHEFARALAASLSLEEKLQTRVGPRAESGHDLSTLGTVSEEGAWR